jgi:hypothetical protein
MVQTYAKEMIVYPQSKKIVASSSYSVLKDSLDSIMHSSVYMECLKDKFHAAYRVMSRSKMRGIDIVSPCNYTYMKRLAITPTRLVYFSEALVKQNRILRMFPDTEFLLVWLCDDHFRKLVDTNLINEMTKKIH